LGSASVLYGFIAEGQPTALYVIFGLVALLASLGDIRMMLSRGIQGKQRITRHLWRMCLALFIAAGSFFLGQSNEFPEQFRNYGLLAIPVLMVLSTMFYWLVRVSFTQWYRRFQQKFPANVSVARPAIGSER
jgi:peptidoglycan/LPS O-acetylase OafA/YrhL